MNIDEELRMLGFSNNEIKIYLTLLRIGESKAGRIAKEAFLERTSTYNSLKKLQEKGLVSSIIESNRKIFCVADPERIVEFFKEKQEQSKNLIPKLRAIKQFEHEKESIVKFRGYNGVKNVLNDILKTLKDKEEYLILGSEGQLSERMPIFANIFVARKDERKLRTRILVREDSLKNNMSKYTTTRYMPQNYVSSTVISIYDNKVSMILWSEIPEAIIIDDAGTALTFRSYFESLWENAKITKSKKSVISNKL
jgi:sugar-specific transcriptional regulator TrmB